MAAPVAPVTPPALPEMQELALWRLVPGRRPVWQPGLLRHDPDLGGWSWEDGADPSDAPKAVPRGYWTPPCLDAHTHLGDAFLRPEREQLPRDLSALVAPPDGYKHRRLREVDTETQTRAVVRRIVAMVGHGSSLALDFREGGLAGLRMLHHANETAKEHGARFTVRPYARPATSSSDQAGWKNELDAILEVPEVGIGISGLGDLPAALLDHAADRAHGRGRRLALHLSEGRREDVEAAIALQPSFVVHCVHAEFEDLAALADNDVMVVACPTSNRFFGAWPPIAALHRMHRDHDLSVALGTDNAMLGDGDLGDEAREACRMAPDADLDFLFQAMTWTPWNRLDLGPDPDVPGLVWGVDPKAPEGHPEEVSLDVAERLFGAPAYLAPSI